MFDKNEGYGGQNGVRVGLIVSGWHKDLVASCERGFTEALAAGSHGLDIEILRIEAPGALEFPLLANKMARSGKFDAIALMALVVDGGIYRHDFVAQSVIDGIVRVSLETGTPVLSAVLTPHHFHESDAHTSFFSEHLREKGKELALAVFRVRENLRDIELAASQPLQTSLQTL